MIIIDQKSNAIENLDLFLLLIYLYEDSNNSNIYKIYKHE